MAGPRTGPVLLLGERAVDDSEAQGRAWPPRRRAAVRRPATREGVPVTQPVRFRSADAGGPRLQEVMERVGHGDKDAFAVLYDAVCATVFGIVVKAVRDRAQSEEVAQEVMIDLWRQAARYRPEQGTVMTRVATIAHRRAVDRVRSARASSDREHATAVRDRHRLFDEVAEEVEGRLEGEQAWRA